MSNIFRRWFRVVSFTAAIKVCNMALGFGVAVVLARALGTDGYGVYTTAFVYAAVISIIIQLGLPKLVLRETATAVAHGNYLKMAKVWRWSTRFVFYFSLVTIIGFIVLLWVGGGITEERNITNLLALILIPLLGLGALIVMAIRGLGYILWSQIPDLIIRPGVLLLSALTLGVMLPAEPFFAMLLQVCAVSISFVVGVLALSKIAPIDTKKMLNGSTNGNTGWLRSTVYFALAGGAIQINQYGDILILSLIQTSEDVGLYRIAYQVSTLASFGTYVVNMIAAPLMARHHAVTNDIKQSRILRYAVLGSVVIALVVLMMIIQFGEPFLSMTFGREYVAASSVLVILGYAQLMNAVGSPVRFKLEMTGHERINARLHIGAALINIVLNLVLVPNFGILGAGYATLISVSMLTCALWWCNISIDLNKRHGSATIQS